MLLEDYGLVGDLQSVGNFAQAFSHLTLILAASAIATVEAGR